MELHIKDFHITISEKLSSLLNYSIDFRKFQKRFIRYSNQYQNPFIIESDKNYGKKDIDWIPGIMNSISFDYNQVFDFYYSRDTMSSLKKKISNFKEAFEIKHNKSTIQKNIDKMNNELFKLNKTLENRLDDIKKFSFKELEKESYEKLIKKIDEKLSPLKEELYYIKKRVNQLKNTLKINLDYTLDDDLFKLFEEVKICFKDEIKKSYNELLSFNSKLLSERKNIAQQQLKKFVEKEKNINRLIVQFENEKKKNLILLILLIIKKSIFMLTKN